MTSRFYITTAIDYPNGVPHMGHAYEKTLADFYARFARLRGDDTWFLIGLDEHGLKIQQAAAAAGQPPRDFVDEKSTAFIDIYRLLEVSSDDFIRTSEARHHAYASELWKRVDEAGDIYLGTYRTDYCVSCEEAVTKSDLAAGKCAGHEIIQIDEESYFFRLGKYRDAVRKHVEDHPEFIAPAWRRAEILSRLDGEVFDLSVSRSSFEWGVPVPNDPRHVMYVWFDALSNYRSALSRPDATRERYWPASCHVIGKDILWFHTVIWPAMLLSAGLELPRQVYAHGFVLDKDGRKMAKSLGNVVDPLGVAQDFGVDALRYYFLRAFASGQDGRFSIEELEERYKSELGNDLGNLVMRLSKLGLTRAGGHLASPPGHDVLAGGDFVDEFARHVDEREHHRALDAVWTKLRGVNAYLNETAPWKEPDDAKVAVILARAVRAMETILHLLEPAMPGVARRAAAPLGIEIGPLARLGEGRREYAIGPAEALFPRRDAPATPPADVSAPTAASTSAPAPAKPAAPVGDVDPFAKLEIRVGVVTEVREHPDADALWALTVDVGGVPRSICAGLRAHVTREELEGRKVVIVANLKPAKLRGIDSCGMILATDQKDGRVVPVDPGDAASGELVTVEGIDPAPKAKLSTKDLAKAPLVMGEGRVTYTGRALTTSAGPIVADAEDGAEVR